MGVLRAEDILRNSGDVAKAMREKEAEAMSHYKETGSYPSWWETHICVHKKVGRAPKFVNADEYFSKGYEYFEKCAAKDRVPTLSGLTLSLGFTNRSTFEAHIRRNIEYRDAHATLMTMMQAVHESGLTEPGNQTGKLFLIKNIPDGLAPTDDVKTPMNYSWQDKKVTELTGLQGGPIELKRSMSPEEAYLQMIGSDAVMEDEADETKNETKDKTSGE